MRTLADLQPAAEKSGAVLSLPSFERTPAEIEEAARSTTAEADRRLALLAAQDLSGASFESTVAALDDILHPVGLTASRIYLMQETQPDRTLREACVEPFKRLQEWQVGVTYREDVYRAVKAFADAYEAGTRPALVDEDLKLYRDTMRDYRRAGLHLPRAVRDEVEGLQKELARLSTDFDRHINQARAVLAFTQEELEGVPASFLESVRRSDGRYEIQAHVTPHYLAVSENAKSEQTRKRLEIARFSLAQGENTALLDQIVSLRDRIASLLGYASWADYQTEPRMAKTAARAIAFLEELRGRVRPKLEQELLAFGRRKAQDTGETQIRSWDWRYYENQLKKESFRVDAEALRAFFPLERVRDGMFAIYGRIFGLVFEEIENSAPWAPGVSLYVASDAATGEPLGLFYLDNFPREGKYNHFAQFGIVDGRRLPDGRSLRPVVALVCNFAPPTGEKPSLLSHQEVETLFHEFGHALHSILTRARYAQFSGTSVPRDFVEAPSQMLENWVWEAEVLDRFAADHRDPSRKIDKDQIRRMREAKIATAGTFYSRQLALALADLRLHAAPGPKEAQRIVNDTLAEVFVAPPEGTHFGAYWGHLTGYDAGYYGYLWSEAIAADMATVFEQAAQRFLDAEAGRRLREEVYAVGGSREAEEIVRRFLGRERSMEPFLKQLGLERAA